MITMTTERKIDLLSKPVWTYKEIMEYDQTIKSPTTAIKIKNDLIKLGGGVPYGSKYVLTDFVLQLYGTTREEELRNLKILIDG